jgi:dTDP-glucose 4,6-dehydratase/UDP-glucuronate decarboxylase
LTPSRTGTRPTAEEVVRSDLELIVDRLAAELQTMTGKRLLITGGAGFLGYYLVQAVLEWNRRIGEDQRIELSVLDSYARGSPDWLARSAPKDGLNVIEHDVRRPLPPELGHFEYVIHAAGIASPTYYRRHPIETMDANVLGLRLLLDRALEASARGLEAEGFLFFSSSEIYGDPTSENIPTPETYRGNVSCTGPRACYDESKRYGETLCVNFARHHGLPITIVRPFNNYGPGLKMTDRRVIPDLARDVFEGRDVTLFSDGSATRTFCYVADAVVGYFKALIRGRPGEPYNIGTEEPEISMAELAERIVSLAATLFGYTGKVVTADSPESDYLVDNPSRRRPLITKAREELGYVPSVTLDDGLERTLLWYSAHRAGAEA